MKKHKTIRFSCVSTYPKSITDLEFHFGKVLNNPRESGLEILSKYFNR